MSVVWSFVRGGEGMSPWRTSLHETKFSVETMLWSFVVQSLVIGAVKQLAMGRDVVYDVDFTGSLTRDI